MIGRLGPGELRANVGSDVKSFYVDGGFAQIENNVVTVLPGRSVPVAQIDVAAAREALQAAQNQAADSPELAEIKNKSIAQARAQIRLGEKSS